MVVYNSADNCGGGVHVAQGMLALNRSEIGNNAAGKDGGGLFIRGGNGAGVASLANATVSNNLAFASGGGFYNEGTLSLSFSTVAGNISDYDNNMIGAGGGIFNSSGSEIIEAIYSAAISEAQPGYQPAPCAFCSPNRRRRHAQSRSDRLQRFQVLAGPGALRR